MSTHGQEYTVRRFTLNVQGDMIKTSRVEKLFINTPRSNRERSMRDAPIEPSDTQRRLNLDSSGRPNEYQRQP